MDALQIAALAKLPTVSSDGTSLGSRNREGQARNPAKRRRFRLRRADR
jgi:hypothetical protein